MILTAAVPGQAPSAGFQTAVTARARPLIAALYVRAGIALEPVIYGGGKNTGGQRITMRSRSRGTPARTSTNRKPVNTAIIATNHQ